MYASSNRPRTDLMHIDKYFPGVPTKISNLPVVCGRFGDSTSGKVCIQSRDMETIDGAPLDVLSSVEASNKDLAIGLFPASWPKITCTPPG